MENCTFSEHPAILVKLKLLANTEIGEWIGTDVCNHDIGTRKQRAKLDLKGWTNDAQISLSKPKYFQASRKKSETQGAI